MGVSDSQYLLDRGVNALVHFTPASNLPSIIENGLLPPTVLSEKGLHSQSNDDLRLDGANHLNLSITNPNIKLLYTFRKKFPDRTYAILKLNPCLLDNAKHAFSSTNAAANRSQLVNVEELFGGQRPAHFQPCWTTDNQAEILVYEAIAPEAIMEIGIFCDSFESDRLVEETRTVLARNHHAAPVSLIEYKYDKAPLESCNASKEEAVLDSLYLESWTETIPVQDQVQKAYALHPKTTLFDSVAYTQRTIKEICKANTDRMRQGHAMWSLRFQAINADDAPIRNDAQLSAIAALEKIVNRGRKTVVSPSLETSISEAITSPELLDRAIAAAHNIQATIIELVKQNRLVNNCALKAQSSTWTQGLDYLFSLALDDLKEISQAICALYETEDLLEGLHLADDAEDGFFTIHLDGEVPNTIGEDEAYIVSEGGTVPFSMEFTRVQTRVPITLTKAKLKPILEVLLSHVFGFDTFRPNQIDGLVRAIKGLDTVVLLPTGSGKSVIYQLLSLITPGIAFVVDPIVSLIEDQVDNLYARGIDRVVGISGALSKEEKRRAMHGIGACHYSMAFVSPERFQIQEFLDAVSRHASTNIISLIAIDEAHCVSEWGHDFRTAYLGLADTCRKTCGTAGQTPPLLALTGTASPSVLRDMQRDLGIMSDSAVIVPSSFDRQELVYRVVRAPLEKKHDALGKVLAQHIPNEFGQTPKDFYALNGADTNCGIIFCPNTNGPYGFAVSASQARHGSEGVWEEARKTIPDILVYSGKKPKNLPLPNEKWDITKRNFAKAFKDNETCALAATKAFGMGIDKPNIRWVVHFGIPSSLEAYYQEAGRAGRDRNHSVCYIILTNDYEQKNAELLDPSKTAVKSVLEEDAKTKGRWTGDDISRLLFFHSDAFKGLDLELNTCRNVAELCHRSWGPDKRFHLSFPSDEDENAAFEKAIYRLQLIGVFEDYRIDYAASEYVIRAEKLDKQRVLRRYIDYVAAYQNDKSYLDNAQAQFERLTSGKDGIEFIVSAMEALLRGFTYSVVEEGRRRAIKKMLDVAMDTASYATQEEADSAFRQQLLDYLKTDKKLGLEDLIENATDISLIKRISDSAMTAEEISSLIGQIDRYLEAYPQNYGLHFVKMLQHFKEANAREMASSLLDLAHFGTENYGVSVKETLAAAVPTLEGAQQGVLNDIPAQSWERVHLKVRESLGEDADLLLALNIPGVKTLMAARKAYNIAQLVKGL